MQSHFIMKEQLSEATFLGTPTQRSHELKCYDIQNSEGCLQSVLQTVFHTPVKLLASQLAFTKYFMSNLSVTLVIVKCLSKSFFCKLSNCFDNSGKKVNEEIGGLMNQQEAVTVRNLNQCFQYPLLLLCV